MLNINMCIWENKAFLITTNRYLELAALGACFPMLNTGYLRMIRHKIPWMWSLLQFRITLYSSKMGTPCVSTVLVFSTCMLRL